MGLAKAPPKQWRIGKESPWTKLILLWRKCGVILQGSILSCKTTLTFKIRYTKLKDFQHRLVIRFVRLFIFCAILTGYGATGHELIDASKYDLKS